MSRLVIIISTSAMRLLPHKKDAVKIMKYLEINETLPDILPRHPCGASLQYSIM